jgi:hypothetical protein
MCGCQSDEVDPDSAKEPPVPAGLSDPSQSITAMLEFFDLSPFELAAAAEQSPPLAEIPDRNAAIAEWLESVDAATLRRWLLRCLTGEPAAIKAECLRKFRKSSPLPKWPTTKGTRSMTELMQRANQLAEVEKEKKEKRKQQARRKRLADMAKSPDKYLGEVSRHVALRGRDEYEAAAQLLSDLREAIGGPEGEEFARKHAARLKKKHPTLRILTGALRSKGLLS